MFQGGNSALINHHYYAGSQKYALDIIDPVDGQLSSNAVTDLNKYKTFGKSLYSPSEGVVVAVENTLPDQKIGESDFHHPAGNYIVISTNASVYILLAHLQHDSVLVAEGDKITVGQELAKIGNSGNTTQPHLHIQAMTDLDYLNFNNLPVPIKFKPNNEKPEFLKRNDILQGS